MIGYMCSQLEQDSQIFLSPFNKEVSIDYFKVCCIFYEKNKKNKSNNTILNVHLTFSLIIVTKQDTTLKLSEAVYYKFAKLFFFC